MGFVVNAPQHRRAFWHFPLMRDKARKKRPDCELRTDYRVLTTSAKRKVLGAGFSFVIPVIPLRRRRIGVILSIVPA